MLRRKAGSITSGWGVAIRCARQTNTCRSGCAALHMHASHHGATQRQCMNPRCGSYSRYAADMLRLPGRMQALALGASQIHANALHVLLQGRFYCMALIMYVLQTGIYLVLAVGVGLMWKTTSKVYRTREQLSARLATTMLAILYTLGFLTAIYGTLAGAFHLPRLFLPQ